MSTTQPPTNAADKYDSPWKEAIEHYFPEFMAFYFPDAYSAIDCTYVHVKKQEKSTILLEYRAFAVMFFVNVFAFILLSGSSRSPNALISSALNG